MIAKVVQCLREDHLVGVVFSSLLALLLVDPAEDPCHLLLQHVVQLFEHLRAQVVLDCELVSKGRGVVA